MFKVTIKTPPAGTAPVQRNVMWTLTGENFPDITINRVRVHLASTGQATARVKQEGAAAQQITHLAPMPPSPSTKTRTAGQPSSKPSSSTTYHISRTTLRVRLGMLVPTLAQGDTLFFNIKGYHALSVLQELRAYTF